MESSLTPSNIGYSENDQHSGKKLQKADLSTFNNAQESRVDKGAVRGEFSLQVNSVTQNPDFQMGDRSKANTRSCTDLSLAYKVLSDQLLSKEKQAAIIEPSMVPAGE